MGCINRYAGHLTLLRHAKSVHLHVLNVWSLSASWAGWLVHSWTEANCSYTGNVVVCSNHPAPHTIYLVCTSSKCMQAVSCVTCKGDTILTGSADRKLVLLDSHGATLCSALLKNTPDALLLSESSELTNAQLACVHAKGFAVASVSHLLQGQTREVFDNVDCAWAEGQVLQAFWCATESTQAQIEQKHG